MRRSIAPLQLGCCCEPSRCILCPPPPVWPSAEKVSALLQQVESESGVGGRVIAGFYGGPPPCDEQLLAAKGHEIYVRVRPDLLTKSQARRLCDAGVVSIELDALSFHDDVLRECGRRYRGALVQEMAQGLKAMGMRVGIVLAPGLPRSSHERCLQDAQRASECFDVARIHPVLVFADSHLRELHMSGRYRALELGEGITTSLAMLEIFEEAGVEVIRIGQQPGPDELGRAVAGPRHSSLRELVESRRTLQHLRQMLAGAACREHMAIRCAPADETRTRGPFSQHIRTLRAEYGLKALDIVVDNKLCRGEYVVQPIQ